MNAVCIIITISILVIGCTPGTGTIGKPVNDNVITVSVDEEPHNPHNLKRIKIASIEVSPTGELKLTVLNENPALDRLRTALVEIPAKGDLQLTAENMEGGNLVMYAFNVSPTNELYPNAVRDALVYYGFSAELR
jgi:hypothetical protein